MLLLFCGHSNDGKTPDNKDSLTSNSIAKQQLQR